MDPTNEDKRKKRQEAKERAQHYAGQYENEDNRSGRMEQFHDRRTGRDNYDAEAFYNTDFGKTVKHAYETDEGDADKARVDAMNAFYGTRNENMKDFSQEDFAYWHSQHHKDTYEKANINYHRDPTDVVADQKEAEQVKAIQDEKANQDPIGAAPQQPPTPQPAPPENTTQPAQPPSTGQPVRPPYDQMPRPPVRKPGVPTPGFDIPNRPIPEYKMPEQQAPVFDFNDYYKQTCLKKEQIMRTITNHLAVLI